MCVYGLYTVYCMYVCMYVLRRFEFFRNVCLYVMYVYMFACLCLCLYVHKYLCMNICMSHCVCIEIVGEGSGIEPDEGVWRVGFFECRTGPCFGAHVE